MYTSRIRLDEELALDLLDATDKYLLDDLKDVCEEYLSENINLDNLVNLANLAENKDLSSLRRAITSFVPKNLKRILENKDLYQLPHNYYWDILSETIPFKN